jgi:subtilisin family serine protease
VAALIAALRTDPRIVDAQPNYYYRYQQAGSSQMHGAGLQYALAKLDAPRAQTLACGRGALVAVIDTGADATHPDLAGAILESFDAAGGKRGADPHGTAIAGIIAAKGTLRGVAPDASLLNVRAFAPAGSDGAHAATTMSLLRGMEWALARGARVLNMSFTGPKDALLELGIITAGDRGAIIVAAAGNGGANAPFAYPAAYAPVIAVTAIDVADRRYREANEGRYIAVAAPGVDILTASTDHAYRLQSGTSFAAAHVSGIIALMLERDPALTASAARRALMATATDLGPPGPDDQYGAGRPNAFAALGVIARH